MAHKLLDIDMPLKQPKIKRFHVKMPSMTGKFGFSLFIGKKEVFIGVSVGEVEIEQIVRKRLVKLPKKASVKVFRFD